MSKDSPAAILYDVNGNPLDIVISGMDRMFGVRSLKTEALLEQILEQLKIANMHLGEISDFGDVNF